MPTLRADLFQDFVYSGDADSVTAERCEEGTVLHVAAPHANISLELTEGETYALVLALSASLKLCQTHEPCAWCGSRATQLHFDNQLQDWLCTDCVDPEVRKDLT